MSLWWTKKEQLDQHQMQLIENIPLRENALILGPPGSGKTNVLLRRAQFVRGQNMPNVLVLTFTRPLTEFIKTGCYDANEREIFPVSCVNTLESWQRALYRQHQADLPQRTGDFIADKRRLAGGALALARRGRRPKYQALFVDESQDLLNEEVELLGAWSDVLFFVGDDRQRIYDHNEGLAAVRSIPGLTERALPFHYRVGPSICEAADRILCSEGSSLASTSHYTGPTPARITVAPKALEKGAQIAATVEKLKQQTRVYADFIRQGDRIGVVVPRVEDRSLVFDAFENDAALHGKCKIMRAREQGEHGYDPSFDADTPICILSVKGCKGLEFRAVHWLFSDDLSHHYNDEHYYTVVTRAKTSLDILYTSELPEALARAYAEPGVPPW